MPPKSVPRKPAGATPAVSTSRSSQSAGKAISHLWQTYQDDTAPRLKLIDSFMIFVMLSGIACFLYCILVTDFPFNSFLGAYVSMFCWPCTCHRLHAKSHCPMLYTCSMQQLLSLCWTIRTISVSTLTSQS